MTRKQLFTLNPEAFLAPEPLAKARLITDSRHALVEKTARVTALEVPEPLPADKRELIRQLFDAPSPVSRRIGCHPHFDDLEVNAGKMHHCTSVFIDIKDSTHLGVVLAPYPVTGILGARSADG